MGSGRVAAQASSYTGTSPFDSDSAPIIDFQRMNKPE